MKHAMKGPLRWGSLLAALLVSVAVLANPYYKPWLLSEDVHQSCRTFELASDGTLSAVCFGKKVPGSNTNYVATTTSIGLDDNIGSSKFEKRLVCGWTNFLSACKDASVTAKENGLHLTAMCKVSAMWEGNELNLEDEEFEMNLNDCFKVDNGALVRK